METKDLQWMRNQSVEALQKALADAEQRLHTLRFRLSSNQLKTVREIREIRQELARISTVLHQKEKTKV
ncbi:MAG: 50S ribosomal protein L29 [Candidatus Uhrbacteria bacterium GW2011_GWA2_53_10]|uniref:Large ribosomal subunit protein uL29 n=1 Tax=Candidatus Uhrbacteria bacterium GW2011_GWA2_53_10 TaxID=1618980 RepID=A0A0G1XQX6_9BACT|nr:MAG: 50S ribosomal protein L29 [Candidatus Uhrbacteria bacterium GW2011_GWA2_53_10]